MGSGPALLCDTGWITDLRAQLELFSFGSFIERLAERFTVIRYDKPGCGLSDPDGIDLSFDGQVTAALAVADALGVGRFRLFGASQGGQLAAAIAATYPDRVEALALYGTCASGRDLAPAEVRDSIVALVEAHWGLGLKALAGAFVTDPTAEDLAGVHPVPAGERLGRRGRRPPGGLLRDRHQGPASRRSGCPRRCCTARRTPARRSSWGGEAAAMIPGATLIPLPGASHVFYHGDWLAVPEAMLGFLAERASEEPQLTGRELQVAELVAEGLTNQAIASRCRSRRGPPRRTWRTSGASSGEFPGPDRDVGDRAPAALLSA